MSCWAQPADDGSGAFMEQLHDLVLPSAVSYFPRTPAWLVLGALVLAAIGFGLVLYRGHAARNRYRRLALDKLADIETRSAYPELPALVKQTAMCVFARADIASLHGDAWLGFLDKSYGGTDFTAGPGRILPELAYGSTDTADGEAVFSLVRLWIRKHHV